MRWPAGALLIACGCAGNKVVSRTVSPEEAASAVRPIAISAIVRDGTSLDIKNGKLTTDASTVVASEGPVFHLRPSDKITFSGRFFAGDPVPGGGKIVTEPTWWLLLPGIGLLGLNYAVLGGVYASTQDRNRNLLFVPVFGGIAFAAAYESDSCNGWFSSLCNVTNDIGRTYAVIYSVISASLQLSAIGFFVATFAMPTTTIRLTPVVGGARLEARF